MSIDAFAILAFGLIWGLAHAPSLSFGGYVAQRIPISYLVQMFIGIIIWALCMFLWIVLLDQIHLEFWTHASRRKNSLFLLLGFVLGIYLSYRIVEKLDKREKQ